MGKVIQEKDKGQELGILSTRMDKAKSFSYMQRVLHLKSLTGNLPQGTAKDVMLELIFGILTSKEARVN